MTHATAATPVQLIPSRHQTLWGWPAVLNFFLGGVGAGLYVVAALAHGSGRAPAMAVAAWLGPALVLAGFASVGTEAGRPLRGARLLARIRTSWMSRELLLGGLFVALALAEIAWPAPALRLLAAGAGLLLALAQGFMLRRARGIPAWDVAIMPVVFGLSALVSGAGAYAVLEASAGRALAGAPLAAIPMILIASALGWSRYLGWSRDPAFVDAVSPLAEGRETRTIIGTGHAAPVLLVALGAGMPAVAIPATALAGLLMLAAQWRMKSRLILTAGHLRPITIPRLRIRRIVP